VFEVVPGHDHHPEPQPLGVRGHLDVPGGQMNDRPADNSVPSHRPPAGV
jgi:hypothetical protein